MGYMILLESSNSLFLPERFVEGSGVSSGSCFCTVCKFSTHSYPRAAMAEYIYGQYFLFCTLESICPCDLKGLPPGGLAHLTSCRSIKGGRTLSVYVASRSRAALQHALNSGSRHRQGRCRARLGEVTTATPTSRTHSTVLTCGNTCVDAHTPLTHQTSESVKSHLVRFLRTAPSRGGARTRRTIV